MMIHQAEWFLAGAFFEPFECVIGDDISSISSVFSPLSHFYHSGIIIRSLSGQDVPVIKAGRVGFEVPFADHCGFVADFLQQFGEGLLAAVKLFSVVDDAVNVTVFACQDYRPAGGADGISAEAIVKEHTLLCETVEVRSFIDFAAITAQRM